MEKNLDNCTLTEDTVFSVRFLPYSYYNTYHYTRVDTTGGYMLLTLMFVSKYY